MTKRIKKGRVKRGDYKVTPEEVKRASLEIKEMLENEAHLIPAHLIRTYFIGDKQAVEDIKKWKKRCEEALSKVQALLLVANAQLAAEKVLRRSKFKELEKQILELKNGKADG